MEELVHEGKEKEKDKEREKGNSDWNYLEVGHTPAPPPGHGRSCWSLSGPQGSRGEAGCLV